MTSIPDDEGAVRALVSVMYGSGVGPADDLPHHAADILAAIREGRVPGIGDVDEASSIGLAVGRDSLRQEIASLRGTLAVAAKERDDAYETIVTARTVGEEWQQRAIAAKAERDALAGLLREAVERLEPEAYMVRTHHGVKVSNSLHERITDVLARVGGGAATTKETGRE